MLGDDKERLLKGLRYLNADLSAICGNNHDGSLICPILDDESLLKNYFRGIEGDTHYDEFIKREQGK